MGIGHDSVFDDEAFLLGVKRCQILHVGEAEVLHLSGHDRVFALAGFVRLQRVVEIVFVLARQFGKHGGGTVAIGTVTRRARCRFGFTRFGVAAPSMNRQGKQCTDCNQNGCFHHIGLGYCAGPLYVEA